MKEHPDPLNPQFGSPIGPWHTWFAWRPVKTYDQRTMWLRWVWRRCIQKHDFLHGGSDFWWQYAVIENVDPRQPS